MACQFTLESSQVASREGKLSEWVRDYLLHSEWPNPSLWQRIEERAGFLIGPVRVPTKRLTRFTNGTDSLTFKQLRQIKPLIDDLPPIIVHYKLRIHDGRLLDELIIADGNHRHRYCEDVGYVFCWAIVELGSLLLD